MADVSDVVIGSTVVVVATTIIRKEIESRNTHGKDAHGKPLGIGSVVGKPIIYGFLLVMSLLTIGFVAPGVAKGLAYLSLVGAFVVNGPTLFDVMRSIK